jgi:hydroxypyruvate isomerase
LPPTRRTLCQTVLGGLAIDSFAHRAASQEAPAAAKQQGNLRQSACKWCFRTLTVEELARGVAAIGMKSVELVPPEDWPVLKKYGLTCAMASYGDALRNPQIKAGLNRKENHDAWEQYFRQFIDASADAGVPNVICFSGWREGMSDEEGLENCAIGLKRVIGQAEKRGVTLCMETLNSKFEGKPGEYMCDHTAWGVKLVQRVGSPRFKLLYDIYHMQIMEGDVIRTITQNWDYIAHYHAAGNPGRHEIDENQELNYGAIARALAEKNYSGYLAQEFLPRRDPLASLGQAFRICDV